MRKLKVMTIVGTRPEVIKMSRIIPELDRYTNHLLVHSGQNFDYELSEIFFDEMGLRKPDHFLGVAAESAAEAIGRTISSADALFARESPDAVVFYGDTNTCLAVIPAKRRRIPVFHVEAGNRCFDQRVPEEINRKIVDHLSDVNLTLTEHARRYLLAEGLPADRIIVVGSPMREVLDHYARAIEASDVLARLNLEKGRFFLVSAHREETVDSPERLSGLLETLEALAQTFKRRVLVSTHPRTQKRMAEVRAVGRGSNGGVEFSKPFGFFDYVTLERNAFCVLSDSGTLTEEAALLGFPAVMIREAHERPEGMDEAVVIMSGLGRERILQSVDLVTRQNFRPNPVRDYGSGNVSQKVVRIILSSVDVVNRRVWFCPPSR